MYVCMYVCMYISINYPSVKTLGVRILNDLENYQNHFEVCSSGFTWITDYIEITYVPQSQFLVDRIFLFNDTFNTFMIYMDKDH